MQRSVLQSKQDAQEQKAKSDWLTFRGPHVVIENHQPPVLDKSNESENNATQVDMKLACHIAGILSKRIDVDIDEQKGDDFPFVAVDINVILITPIGHVVVVCTLDDHKLFYKEGFVVYSFQEF